MASEIAVSLDIAGAFDPDEVTRRLGVVPSRTWRCGDQTRLKAVVRKEDGWRVDVPKEPSLDLQAQVTKLFAKIGQRFADVGRLREDLAAVVMVSCAVYADSEDSTPAISLSLDVLQRLTEMGASLDIDLYLT